MRSLRLILALSLAASCHPDDLRGKQEEMSKTPTADELQRMSEEEFLAVVDAGIARARRLLEHPRATEAHRAELRTLIRTLESVRREPS